VIRTVLVDDELDSIRVMERLLEAHCPNINIVGKAGGVETALELIQSTRPDLLFLDIEMTQGNAFDLLNKLKPLNFLVIFVTAFAEYAIRGFKYSALDYLLKPIDIDELVTAVGRAAERLQEKNLTDQLKIFQENIGTYQLYQQKLAVPIPTGLMFVVIKDIIRLEAKGSYTMIHLPNKEHLLTTRNIKEYETLLPDSIFFRAHNSHIINLLQIKKYHKGRGGSVIMEDGSSIDVASRRREEFIRRMIR
jgi:two-component system LytT family response regulator